MDPTLPIRAARPWNPLLAFGLALGVCAAASLAAHRLPASVTTRYPWSSQAVQQGLMTLVALVAMRASGRRLAEFGFRRPEPATGRFVLWGLVLGMTSAGIMMGLGLTGMRARLATYGLPGMVLWIWLVSSVVEEIFVRGWFQSLVAGAAEDDPRGERARAAVFWSAALFGTMHLFLLFGGVGIATVAVIVPSVTALGLVCATARARTGSLRPAIAAHVAFNVGGFVAGVIYGIAYRVTTGQLPPAL